jgi:hypothetical protein
MRPDAASGGRFGRIRQSSLFLRQTLYNRMGNNNKVNTRGIGGGGTGSVEIDFRIAWSRSV